jgi:two-component system, NtrC family, sensor kinase
MIEKIALDAVLAALDHARIGVFVSVERGGELCPIASNKCSAARLGYTVEEALAVPWLETLAPYERTRVIDMFQRVLAGEVAPRLLEIDLLHKDGHCVPSELAMTQIAVDGGHAYVTMVHDRGHVSALEADRMAVVGALAAGIAHEINNPLTYVLLHLRSLRRSIEDWGTGHVVEAARRVDEAYAGAERIRAITRSVMTFAAAPGPPIDVDLGAVVQSALRLARPELESRARVVVQMFPVAAVRADEPRLGQTVLSMLLFSSAGFPGDDPTLNRVVVAVEMRDDQVVLEVADNGRDLSPEELARAFDPAFVVRSHPDAPAFGLGVAHAIAIGAGGRLVIALRPGGGVVTTLSLPQVPATAADQG